MHWWLSIWFMLAVGKRVASTLQTGPAFSTSIYSANYRHTIRQLPIPVLATTTVTITATYGYPLPSTPAGAPTPIPAPMPTPTPVTMSPLVPGPPILVSFISTPTSLNPTTSLPISAPTLGILPPTANSTTSSLQTSSGPHSSAPQTTLTKSPFKLVYLVPVFAIVGIFLIGSIVWVTYGCCTRKPRMRTDDGGLIPGPPYVGLDESKLYRRRDVEERGTMAQVNNRNRGIDTAFRWPSFNETPGFDPIRGFHVPDEYLDEQEPFSQSALVANRPKAKSCKSSRTIRTVRQGGTAGPSHGRLSPPSSDTTSMALLDLYESDEEGESRRRAREVPWESLRHKSIKRGILEEVKKESKWMDSIRGGLAAGSSFLGSRGGQTKMEEARILLRNVDPDDSMEVEPHVVAKRRGHVRQDSDMRMSNIGLDTLQTVTPPRRPIARTKRTDSFRTTTTTTTTTPSRIPTDFDDESHGFKDTGFRIITESPAPTPGQTLLRGLAWLRGDAAGSESQDKFTPLPDRLKGSHSRSRSTSPVKRMTNGRSQPEQQSLAPTPRDILPQSPSQLMSPPLQSQMCFTPVPPSSYNLRPKPRQPSTTPTKLLASRRTKSRRRQSPENVGINSPRPEPSRGRLAKKVPRLGARPVITQQGSSSSAATVSTTVSTEFRRERERDEALRKVGKIVESSWSTRDLGKEAIGSMSPTAFGRRM
ncbi:hypothetical protein B0H34DRAFT_132362 [Crassisporium funariophilum]|nr:hypothetical protein B0H34DRAFT_132362 [Crassisporium funariophilum]